MKHIFWVHSHTSFYTSLAIIDYLKLDAENIIFISDRNYSNKYFDCEFHDFSCIVNKLSPFTIKTGFFLGRIQKDLDVEIDKIVRDNNFIAYIPHLSHPAFQILITHDKSVGYNFIEEGLANYIIENYQGATFRKFSKAINSLIAIYNYFNNRVTLNHKIFGNYRKYNFEPKYFLIDNKYHIQHKNQVMLTWKPHDVEIKIPQNSIILILGPTLEYNMASRDQFVASLQKLLDYPKVKTSNFYVKYHPYNNESTMKLIEGVLHRNEIKFKIIPNDEPIEQLLRNDKDFTIIGIDSSLLFYAKILNKKNKVISAYKYLLKNDDTYQERCSLRKIEKIFEDGIVVL